MAIVEGKPPENGCLVTQLVVVALVVVVVVPSRIGTLVVVVVADRISH